MTPEKPEIKGCGHKLVKKTKDVEREVWCNNCDVQKINLQKEYWHCSACDFDLC